MGELKPKSFRIDDETAERFKEISISVGGNQQETLAKLIEAYEFQSSKTILTEKKSDIEKFERYVNALTRMYMTSLEDNQNITETVRAEFDALSKSKDAVIQDLQEKMASYKLDAEQSQQNEDRHKNNVLQLEENITSLKKEYQAKIDNLQNLLSSKDLALSEKENMNVILTDNVRDLKKQVADMRAEQEEIKGLSEKIESLIDKIKQLEQEKEKLQVKHERETLSLERKYDNEIRVLKEQQTTEVDKYQTKYRELLEKLEQRAKQPTKKSASTTATKKSKTATRKVEAVEADNK